MTRINCVPPSELHDKHLLAEYRELPRVFALAHAAYSRGEDPSSHPQQYLLGTGHVRFFYSRLGYAQRRFLELVTEMLRRGWAPKFMNVPFHAAVPNSWWRDWQPTDEALAINRQRLLERRPKSAK